MRNHLEILYDQVCRLTTEDEADYVTRYQAYARNRNWKVRKEVFYEAVEMPFENITVPVPRDYNATLSVQFGPNYMTPVRGGGDHEYPYFGKQFRTFKNEIEVVDWVRKRKDMEDKSIDPPGKQSLSESKNTKCVVLYYTGVREMLIYSEFVIDKLRYVFDYFEKNKDRLELRWLPGAFVRDGEGDLPLERVVPELIAEYEALIGEYKSRGIGVCDETGDIRNAIDTCDMYYGDESFVSKLFKLTGKPVYIQDYRIKEMRGEA